jgi:glutamine synthetase
VSDGGLVGFLYCDLGGIVRGRFVPAAQAEDRMTSGVGWVPANQVITPFDTLVTPNPFGSVGDLRLLPAPGARFRLADAGGEPLDFALCGAHAPDGSPWEACPRALLERVAAALEAETGGTTHVAFEHEFRLRGPSGAPGFSLRALRELEPLPGRIVAALAEARLEPEAILPEFGPGQFETPCAPADAVTAADRAVALREIVRDVARRHGSAASFAPLAEPGGAASGVHIHVSLRGADGDNLFADAGGLSALGRAFAGGVLRHARGLSALTAPSAVSGLRLGPGHWSAGRVELGGPDREALLRIPSAGPWLEYRGADATASPYLALAGLLAAGLNGVRGGAGPAPDGLPATLEEALGALEGDTVLCDAMPALLLECYLVMKRGELADLAELDDEARCARYAAVY